MLLVSTGLSFIIYMTYSKIWEYLLVLFIFRISSLAQCSHERNWWWFLFSSFNYFLSSPRKEFKYNVDFSLSFLICCDGSPGLCLWTTLSLYIKLTWWRSASAGQISMPMMLRNNVCFVAVSWEYSHFVFHKLSDDRTLFFYY